MLKRTFFLLAILSITGCTTIQQQKISYKKAAHTPWPKRLQHIGKINTWHVAGSALIKQNKKANIAQFNWQQHKEKYHLNINGPLGVGIATITGSNRYAKIILANGRQAIASNGEELMQKELGWSLPIDNFPKWILGIPNTKLVYNKNLQNNSVLLSLKQQGWKIYYLQYQLTNNLLLPKKIVLVNENITIKLSLTNWKINK
ncbi:MAG: outer membrane lipoprotein LolB [Gammaproteobacteria bacterium]|nr:outer membrane lipoprotein LolB [Gammaproteobacteria bacterium]